MKNWRISYLLSLVGNCFKTAFLVSLRSTLLFLLFLSSTRNVNSSDILLPLFPVGCCSHFYISTNAKTTENHAQAGL